jgi:hypothetical protein
LRTRRAVIRAVPGEPARTSPDAFTSATFVSELAHWQMQLLRNVTVSPGASVALIGDTMTGE